MIALNKPTKLLISYQKNPLPPQLQVLGLYCPYNFCKTGEGELKFKSALRNNQVYTPQELTVYPSLFWNMVRHIKILKPYYNRAVLYYVSRRKKLLNFQQCSYPFFLFKEKSSLIHREQSEYIKQIIIHQPQNYYIFIYKDFA